MICFTAALSRLAPLAPAAPLVLQSRFTWLAADVIQAVKDNDLVGMICLIATAIGSILSWGVIAYKALYLHLAKSQTKIFLERCMGGEGNLLHSFQLAGGYQDSPLAQVLREAYLEMEMVNWYQNEKGLSLDAKIANSKENVERAIEIAASKEIHRLEDKLGLLLGIANVSPLIGLFGTVWGILGAFQVVAKEGTAAVGSLAPGVSTALMTTVAGLIAAIPAVIAYAYFYSVVQDLERRMDAFGHEVSNIIQKNVLRRNSKG
ncbi:MAG TPA: MotA/TolQ/ExbB proton channel family protein [Candidatus Sumerlaeota bacterium]|nr:MotA/TolQ/ExbB proton channel family protein [Candidatus Sumerlaeota bacterium]HRR30941.1 MotA/TolQ/ExbB proton channel family protein [Candidatus Sumerlaeia bacterium]HON49361.1 MotA/TolQ/ExbB proton channel family protein [Candidatus Sumerlaeota bacterium]HOR64891.1 MotA/TolQ/ExbB proton channel family protein [Candidatus Sumerlaeota bacterium]HPL73044.1 MotA/TolQ/ExbB proton channel family protein [Candidatus Sumerlaeota bacterium]